MADSVYEVMVKIGSDTEKFGQNLGKLETKVSKFSGGIKKLAGVIGAAFAVGQIKNAIVDLTEATMAQEKAEKRLETLAKNVPGTTDAQITALKQLASAQQNLTTIGDEVTIAGQSQLATFQLSAETIAKLTPAFQDLAVGTYGANVSQEQMIQSGNLLGKVMQGQVGALSRVGVSFTEAQAEILKTGTESEKAAALIEVLGGNFGGLAQSMRNTREGQIIAMQNAWGDMKEVLGSYILPILGNLASWFSTKIPTIQATLEKLFDVISSVAKPIIDNVLPRLKGAFDNVSSGIKPIVEKVMPIFKDAFESISRTVMPAFIKIFDAISEKVLPNYKKGFDAFAKVAFPIFRDAIKFITEKLVPPLVKIFELAYTKIVPAFSEVFAENMPKIMRIMQTLWEIIKRNLGLMMDAFEFAWPFISKIIEIAIDMIKPLISGLITAIEGIVNFISGVFTGEWSKAWEGIKEIFSGIFGGLINSLAALGKHIVEGLINGIIASTQWAKDKIIGFASGIAGAFKEFFGIKSPSKLTQEYGENIVEGMAIGLEDDSAKKSAKKTAEQIAEEIKKAADEAAKQAEKITMKSNDFAKTLTDNTMNALDKLHDATLTALRKKWDEEESMQLESLSKQSQNLERQTERNIRQYDKELLSKLKLLSDGTDAEVKSIQDKIDALNNLTDKEERELDESEYNQRVSQKRREISEEKDAQRRFELATELEEMKRDRQRKSLLEQRQTQIEAFRKEIEDVRSNAEEKRRILEEENEKKKRQAIFDRDFFQSSINEEERIAKEHYKRLRDNEEQYAKERYLALDGDNKELIALLEKYNPKWQDAGQSFAEEFLYGLNSKKSTIQSAISGIVALTQKLNPSLEKVISQAGELWWKAKAAGDVDLMDRAHQIAESARASLPKFANGTDFAPGGPAIVGERGPEIVNLPRGSQVVPNEKIGMPETLISYIQIDGKTIAQATSKIQAQSNLGKYRALGVVAT